MNKFWIVALETFKRNVKSVTFIVMLFAPLLFIGFIGLSAFIGSKVADTDTVAIVSENPDIRAAVLSQTALDIDKNITTVDAGKKELKKGNIDGYILIDEDEQNIVGTYYGNSSLAMSDKLQLTQILSQFQLAERSKSLGLSETEVTSLMAPAQIKEKTVEFSDGELVEKKDDKFARMGVAMFISFAMFMIILMYAQIISQEVASEKGTRIMEVILSSTSAEKHFYGKIMGIFMVILAQIGVYILTAVMAFQVVKNQPIVKEALSFISIGEIMKALLGYNLIFLLLGVMIYTIAAAFSGSLVSKSEDAAKAVVPVTYITMIGYFLNIFLGMNNPKNLVFVISSYVPFVSSFTMPVRIANDTVSAYEPLISVLILAVATVLLLRLSAKMYRATSLVYSDEGIWKVMKRSLTLLKYEKAV
ncbi:ABC transporter permease [Vagococcus lutrae]|uniref:ABC transporter permease n=1 Tax=Vagococcus lutrae TaxID=81947 RepID=UPI001C96C7F8|nr:ABC transporter permease [Vagococcus lutrae]MDT2812627.1 ABC transporter permease [Vagococcus lutrae]MDT2826319.1 ABC transporter permease [Vagococcus lutrae]MDT2841574.1 ABC transporter permease [Vagococcus lutrae]QZN88555.1 ABC transporter permease [Vagococcus lutrae]UQF22986.1 ABC transporter permease [Vagococcus lutrae]